MTTVDLERVAQVLADVAEQEVLPRWRNLAQGEVREKTGPNDLVTIADAAAERALAARLPALVPGSVLVGGGGVERDAGLLVGSGGAWAGEEVVRSGSTRGDPLQ